MILVNAQRESVSTPGQKGNGSSERLVHVQLLRDGPRTPDISASMKLREKKEF